MYSEDIKESIRLLMGACLVEDNDVLGLYRKLEILLDRKEMYGPDALLFDSIGAQIKVAGSYKMSPVLTREKLINKMEVNLQDKIYDPMLNVNVFMQDIASDITLGDETAQIIVDKIFSATIELYDDIIQNPYNMEKSVDELSLLVDKIKSEMFDVILMECKTIREIGLNTDAGFLFGVEEATEYMNTKCNDMITLGQLATATIGDGSVTHISNINDVKRFEENATPPVPVFPIGQDPIDAKTWVNTKDLWTIIGDEGAGKTRFVCAVMRLAIVAGQNVVVATGESSKEKMFYLILSNHIYNTTNYSFDWQELTKMEDLPEEEQILINSCKMDLFDNPNYGSIDFMEHCYSETFRKDMESLYLKPARLKGRDVGLFVLDHIGTIESRAIKVNGKYLRTEKELADNVIHEIVSMKKDWNFATILTQHTNTDTMGGKRSGPRIGAITGDTTKYSDVVVHMAVNDDLRDRSMVELICKKLRESEFFKPYKCQVKFITCHFKPIIEVDTKTKSGYEYDEEYDEDEYEDDYDEEDEDDE